ncbi:transporter substrate-binding domain-containing protein [Azorhizobium caulinodans]|nr:transporter substrate-binding domain-containing protein [Azorhizobium caulinodans]
MTEHTGEAARLPSGAVFPQERIRAALNFGNVLFTTQDDAGAPVGLGPDLMHALADHFGLGLDIRSYAQPPDVVADANTDAWDVTILAIEPAREAFVAFAAPMTRIEATCVVDAAYTETSLAELDRPGFRLAAMDRSGYELYLSRTLKAATLVKTASFAESIARFNAGEADAVAGLATMLAGRLPDMPRGRLMPHSFQTIHHGFAVPHALAPLLPAINAFVAQSAASVITQAVSRHGIVGLTPA